MRLRRFKAYCGGAVGALGSFLTSARMSRGVRGAGAPRETVVPITPPAERPPLLTQAQHTQQKTYFFVTERGFRARQARPIALSGVRYIPHGGHITAGVSARALAYLR